MQITIGRIVHYRLSSEDAENINRWRSTTQLTLKDAHMGNIAQAGDVLPMLVVRVWGGGSVNGQVFLDGNDSLWVTSVGEGDGMRNWSWPVKQAT